MSQDVSSGMFIPVDKQSLFILVFEEVLLNSYSIIPVFGPTREDNCCEVKFNYVGANCSLFPHEALMAKEFLKRNMHILQIKKGANEKFKKSSNVPEIINLDDDVTELYVTKTVDLTASEPELIVLDDTVNELNRTISELNEDFISINSFNLETELNNSPRNARRRRRKSFGSDVEVLSVQTNKNQLQRTSPLFNVNNSEVTVLNSNVKLKKCTSNQKNLKCSSNLTVEINNSGLRSVKNDIKINALKRRGSKSPLNMASKSKKRKIRNVSNNSSNFIISPANKPLTGNVLNYYSKLNNVVQKVRGRKSKSPRHKLANKQSPRRKVVQSPQRARQRRHLAALQNHNHQFSVTPRRKPCAETNTFNPNPLEVDREGLRPVAIDGSNIARGHGKGSFSVKGIQICVDYFASRGHRIVKVFLPLHCQNNFTTKELVDLNAKCDVVFTPSQIVNGVRKTSYDDRFIVQYAVEFGGVIVSTDNYRDLLKENPRWRDTIEKRLLMFTWVDDFLMFPLDPLGFRGPHLEQFLRF